MRAIHYAVLNEISCSKIIPQTILDVGCGKGSFTRVLSATVPGSNITAIDTSIPKLFSSDHIVFTEGSVEQLPFASESFDLVIAALSLHHWKEKTKALAKYIEFLKRTADL